MTDKDTRHISVGTGSGRFAKTILDEFGAPKLSALTECRAQDVAEWPNHLGTAILNSIFLGIELPAGRRYTTPKWSHRADELRRATVDDQLALPDCAQGPLLF